MCIRDSSITSLAESEHDKDFRRAERSMGSVRSSNSVRSVMRLKISILGQINRVIKSNYFPPSLKVIRYYLFAFILMIITLLLVLDFSNSTEYSDFSFPLRDLTKPNKLSSNLIWTSSLLVQSHLAGLHIITEESYVRRLENKYESQAQFCFRSFHDDSLTLWDKKSMSEDLWGRLWSIKVNLTYNLQTKHPSSQSFGLVDAFSQLVEPLRVFLKPVRGEYNEVQDKAWFFIRTSWLRIAPFLIPTEFYLIDVGREMIETMQVTWFFFTCIACTVFVCALIIVYPIYVKKEALINNHFAIFSRFSDNDLDQCLARMHKAIQKFSDVWSQNPATFQKSHTGHMSLGSIGNSQDGVRIKRSKIARSKKKRSIMIIGIIILCGLSISFFVVRYLVVVSFLEKVGTASSYVAAVFTTQVTASAYASYILWYVDIMFTNLTVSREEASGLRTRLGVVLETVRNRTSILDTLLQEVDRIGPQLGMKDESIALFRRISSENFCHDINLNDQDLNECQSLLNGIARKGLIVTMTNIITWLNVTAELIVKLPPGNASLVKPYIDGQTMSETYALLFYVSRLLVRGTEIIIEDAQVYITEIQLSILFSSIIFGIALIVMYLKIWRRFEKTIKATYQSPFRLLLLLPSDILVSNSFMPSFLKTNIPVEANSYTKV
eukprot:TRINITY_DN156_c0_g2_i2.p1 TRINITY_DN156_c0_g2~~TRINITY_DN156_c0_g2_i2.p1  ORF type:complete len:688 (+),score=33.74 TRINITY_DN156_c0_g2_i2:74-2065(+)